MNSKSDKTNENVTFKNSTMKVLLLDKYWQPLAIISWQKAMSLILTTHKEKAQVIQEYPDQTVHTVSQSFKVPSVVRVFGVGKRHNTIPCTSDNVFYRDQYTCAYCNQKYLKRFLTIDHIFPVVQGGQRSWKNLITACKKCNQTKGGRTPKQANMPLNFRPSEPTWTLAFHLKLNRSDPIKHWSEYIYGLDEIIRPFEMDELKVDPNG